MNLPRKVNLEETLSCIGDHFHHLIIADTNNFEAKLVNVKGISYGVLQQNRCDYGMTPPRCIRRAEPMLLNLTSFGHNQRAHVQRIFRQSPGY